MTRFFRFTAWVLLIAILIVTVGPIQLRPMSGEPANLERFVAFMAVGLAFALAYPHHWLRTLLLIVGCAALFELLQRLAPGRHGEIKDFVFKALGGIIGIAVGFALSKLKLLRERR